MENSVMLLCDIGNTSYHFLDDKTEYKKDVKTFDASRLKEKVYYISVNAGLKSVLVNLDNWIDLSVFIDKSQYYETMGIDRIVAIDPLSDGVVVDAGSAITVDVVKDGVFEGGFIYPGVDA
ncbi:MAG: type III pantothenate kinase, partial [Sulfurimonas sp.]|nr:type III pantothenate kinase [Sulfurimonas sp.]